jgi:4-hydroxyphenylacetate 3-hydroxylase, reductase component
MLVYERGAPVEDPAAFRRSLGQFATGVAVVTALRGETPVGMTSNSFASVSLDPPLVLWSLRRASSSFKQFETCDYFAVNVLASDQVDLSQKFAKSGPDKFDSVEWKRGIRGSPILEGTLAVFECKSVRNHDGGDHLIMVGEVERHSRHIEKQALLFAQGRYATAIDHPQTAPISGQPNLNLDELDLESEALLSLLVRAHMAVARTLALAREAEKLDLMEARVLRAVRSFPGRNLDELLPDLSTGANAAEDVIESLKRRELVTSDTAGKLSLSAKGEASFRNMVVHVRRFERSEMSEIPEQYILATRRVLGTLISRSGPQLTT